MSGHTCAGGLANVEAEVEAVRRVDALECALRALRQIHQLMRGVSWQRGEPVKMRVGHHHDVA